MVQLTQVRGKMICKKVKARRSGRIVQLISENTNRVKRMAMENLPGTIRLITQAIFVKIKYMGKESMNGMMEGCMRESGVKIK